MWNPGSVGVPPGTLTFKIEGLGDVTITERQRRLHVLSEGIAVFLVTPFMAWLAFNKNLPTWARAASGVVAAGTIMVDGGLLWRFTHA